MRFERLECISFGPFQNKELAFAEGMNIVYGPNEAGKSSWHAALFAGLCGLRRGPGKRSAEKDFERRHRPWGPGNWQVSLVIGLADGRRVQLTHDLDSHTGKADDVVLGREYVNEILYDGSPDGSLWLGLNRDTFPAVACVGQGQLLQLLDHPEALQEDLQRAADTFGAEGTAAKALDIIKNFRREHLGSTRANSRKPLRLAMIELKSAERAFEEATVKRQDYDQLLGQKVELATETEKMASRCRLLVAAAARADARAAGERLRKAGELAAMYSHEPPLDPTDQQELMKEATEAAASWKNRPSVAVLPDPRAAQLEQELASLPGVSAGDLEVDPQLARAAQEYEVCRQLLEDHRREKPSPRGAIFSPDLDPEELRSLAETISTPRPAVDPELENLRTSLDTRIEKLRSTQARFKKLLVGGTALLVAGMIFLLFQVFWPGFALLIVGLALIALPVFRNPAREIAARYERMTEVNDELGESRFQVGEWDRAQRAARETLAAIELEPDAGAILARATRVEQGIEEWRALEKWRSGNEARQEQYDRGRSGLDALLRSKGVQTKKDLSGSVEEYQRTCGIRRQRKTLQEYLARALRQEEIARDCKHKRQHARELIDRTVEKCGVSAQEEDLVAALEDWLEKKQQEARVWEQEIKDRSQLESLLEGRSLQELESHVLELEERARIKSTGMDDHETDAIDLDAALSELESARGRERELERNLTRLRTQLSERESSMVSVAEAEEALGNAQAELERVTRLDGVLETTSEFLTKAQEEVHRTVAPQLSEVIREWLPKITGGRYEDARVDPENLVIKVKEKSGEWRAATQLSHGTAEQIYLLLRVALVKYLTQPKETCPLILDDVTVQSDSTRTRAILDTLLALSRERQVILFSQEDEVVEWAEENLREPDHGIIRLDPIPVSG